MSLGDGPPALPRGGTTRTSHGTLDGHVSSQGCRHGASNHSGQRAVLRSGDVSFHEQDDRRLLIQREQKTVRCALWLSGEPCCTWQTAPSPLRAGEESCPLCTLTGGTRPAWGRSLDRPTDRWTGGSAQSKRYRLQRCIATTPGGLWEDLGFISKSLFDKSDKRKRKESEVKSRRGERLCRAASDERKEDQGTTLSGEKACKGRPA